jgi:uncharacterized protein YjiS (DUF1127 family)
MLTQPIQRFQNLTSETTPAGGNALAKIGFSHEDHRLIETNARYARATTVADKISDAILWVQAQFKRLADAVRIDFRLRAAEAQLYSMTDRELADVGLSRTDIPFAVRAAAAEEVAGEAPLLAVATGARAAANQNLRHAA